MLECESAYCPRTSLVTPEPRRGRRGHVPHTYPFGEEPVIATHSIYQVLQGAASAANEHPMHAPLSEAPHRRRLTVTAVRDPDVSGRVGLTPDDGAEPVLLPPCLWRRGACSQAHSSTYPPVQIAPSLFLPQADARRKDGILQKQAMASANSPAADVRRASGRLSSSSPPGTPAGPESPGASPGPSLAGLSKPRRETFVCPPSFQKRPSCRESAQDPGRAQAWLPPRRSRREAGGQTPGPRKARALAQRPAMRGAGREAAASLRRRRRHRGSNRGGGRAEAPWRERTRGGGRGRAGPV